MGEIVKVSEKVDKLRDLLNARQGEIEKMLPQMIRADRFVRSAINAAIKLPELLECSQISFYGALLEAASLGLEVGVAGQGWLIPFAKKVTFIPGYMGLAQLAYKSSRVSIICAGVVYGRDDFTWTDAPPDVVHKRFQGGERGEFVCAYAGFKNAMGHWSWEVMQAWEIEKVKARSPGARKKESPWNHPDDVNEMRKKTAFKRLWKYMPMALEDRALARAIELDNQGESGTDQRLEENVPTGMLFDDTEAAVGAGDGK